MSSKHRYGFHQIENTVTGERKTFNSKREMQEFLKKSAPSLVQFKLGKKDIDNWRYVGMYKESPSIVKEISNVEFEVMEEIKKENEYLEERRKNVIETANLYGIKLDKELTEEYIDFLETSVDSPIPNKVNFERFLDEPEEIEETVSQNKEEKAKEENPYKKDTYEYMQWELTHMLSEHFDFVLQNVAAYQHKQGFL